MKKILLGAVVAVVIVPALKSGTLFFEYYHERQPCEIADDTTIQQLRMRIQELYQTVVRITYKGDDIAQLAQNELAGNHFKDTANNPLRVTHYP